MAPTPKNAISAEKLGQKAQFRLNTDDVRNIRLLVRHLPAMRLSDICRVSLELARAYVQKEEIDPRNTAELIIAKKYSNDFADSKDAFIAAPQTDIFIPSRGHNYDEIIRESRSLALVFNDMYGWIGNHNHKKLLHERICADVFTTDIYLIHPESPAIEYVAAKSNKTKEVAGMGVNRQVHDIHRGLCFLLSEVFSELESKTKTRVFGHQWVHSYSMVMNESAAYFTPYLNKRVGNDGVIHVYRKGAQSPTDEMYRMLLDDLEDMVRYTTDIPNKNLVKYAKAHPEIMDKSRYQD